MKKFISLRIDASRDLFTHSFKSPMRDRSDVYIYMYLVSDRSCASSRSLRFKKAGSLISHDESREGRTVTYTSDYRRGRWESPIRMDAKNIRPARICKWTGESSATNRLSQIVPLLGRFRGHNAIVLEIVTHGGDHRDFFLYTCHTWLSVECFTLFFQFF